MAVRNRGPPGCQHSTSRPATLANPPTLRVTSTCVFATAMEAIMRSFPPIGLSSRRSGALTIPHCRANSSSNGSDSKGRQNTSARCRFPASREESCDPECDSAFTAAPMAHRATRVLGQSLEPSRQRVRASMSCAGWNPATPGRPNVLGGRWRVHPLRKTAGAATLLGVGCALVLMREHARSPSSPTARASVLREAASSG